MMEIKRDYNMSDADLMFMVGDFVAFMTRDAAEFTVRGVTSAARTAFETLGSAFEVFPMDEYYMALVTAEVEAKNAARDEAMVLVQKISGFFEQKWGLDSWQYKQLNIKSLSVASDNNFKAVCRNVINTATEQLANLTSIGLTQTDIDNLETKVQTMEDKGHTIETKKAFRDSKTEERIQKGNELYSYLKQYSSIGKLIWENVDEAKYNDYIIYKSVLSGLSKPQGLVAGYNPGPPEVINLAWDNVIDATSYNVYYSIAMIGSPSGDYSLLNNYPTNSATVSAVLNKRNYFKVKAKNDTQTSDYSDEVFIDVTP